MEMSYRLSLVVISILLRTYARHATQQLSQTLPFREYICIACLSAEMCGFESTGWLTVACRIAQSVLGYCVEQPIGPYDL